MRNFRIIEIIRNDLRFGTERSRLIRSAGVTAALKIGATLIAFLASLIYARALGPRDYGLYAYVMAWTAVISVPAGLGLPLYLLRQGASTPQQVLALRHWADRRLLTSGIVSASLLMIAGFITPESGVSLLFIIASPIPLLTNVGAVRISLLQSRGRIARSQWPRFILGPAAMLLLLSSLWLWTGHLQPIQLIGASLLAGLLALLVNTTQLRHETRKDAAQGSIQRSIKSALPFMWLGSVYLLVSRTDLIMLGLLKGPQDTGIYSIATRMADFVGFFMMAATTAVAPKIAQLHQTGQRELLQRLLSATSRRVLLMTLPVAMIFILTAAPLLSLLFGTQYASGANVLRILALTQFLYVVGGPLGYILDMTGLEHLHLRTMIAAVAINIVLNLSLIPSLGTIGAALATAISITFARAALWYLVRHHRNLRPSGLGF